MTHPIDTREISAAGGPGTGGGETTADQVLQYLRQNPEFLLVQPDLLHDLAPPPRWTGDTVVDFQRFMVDMLRGELAGLRDCTSAVIETSRSNMSVQERTHAAALSLVAAEDMETLLGLVTEDLPVVLGVDAAILAFEPLPAIDAAVTAIGRLAAGEVDALLGVGREARLIARLDGGGALFRDNAPPVRSAALARLTVAGRDASGLLALGAHEEGLFSPDQGTDLLRFLARIIEVCLQRLLPTSS